MRSNTRAKRLVDVENLRQPSTIHTLTDWPGNVKNFLEQFWVLLGISQFDTHARQCVTEAIAIAQRQARYKAIAFC